VSRRLGGPATLVAALLAGYPNKAPWAPSLQPAFGARVTDGKLQIWTGTRCAGVTRVALSFELSGAALVLLARSEDGVEIEHLTLGGPYPAALDISEPLPADFGRDQKSMSLSVHGGSGGWGTVADLDQVMKESAQHPADTYWFQDVGWLDPAVVAAQDGKAFLATCTADPAKKDNGA